MQVHSKEIAYKYYSTTGLKLNSKLVDDALNCLIKTLREDPKHIWNSVEMFIACIICGGRQLSHVRLIKYVSEYVEEDLLMLSSSGIANIIFHRTRTSSQTVFNPSGDSNCPVTSHSTRHNHTTEAGKC